MSDFMTDTPEANESELSYGKRLQKQGQRELYIRKALREHFALDINEAIAVCHKLPTARLLELKELRARFPDLNENRLAWKISKSLTLTKQDALVWAQTLIKKEGGA
ncbi:hypothetical protein JI58_06410 [Marinosulfonomonas sp. PRT-SC04]|nr:hypothetical protein JI58_06410 [Marinosulfonomonas sp. PRT-SC04]